MAKPQTELPRKVDREDKAAEEFAGDAAAGARHQPPEEGRRLSTDIKRVCLKGYQDNEGYFEGYEKGYCSLEVAV